MYGSNPDCVKRRGSINHVWMALPGNSVLQRYRLTGKIEEVEQAVFKQREAGTSNSGGCLSEQETPPERNDSRRTEAVRLPGQMIRGS